MQYLLIVINIRRQKGSPALLKQIASHYSPLLDQDLDPSSNALVTIGCSEGLYLACQAFLNPGDEVILFEPFYDVYPGDVELAGGVPVFQPLTKRNSNNTSADWEIDLVEFEKRITPRTKMVFLNNPMNVPGKVFSKRELEEFSRIVCKHDLIVLSDEVYETLLYDDKQLHRLASLPGMWDRTLSFGSAGKMFSVTGWKVGWIIGAPELIKHLTVLHQFISYCVATPLQEGIAQALVEAKDNGYFQDMTDMFVGKREHLRSILSGCGLQPVVPDGTYFMLADISKVDESAYWFDRTKTRDAAFCEWLPKEIGVTAIPTSAFCRESQFLSNYVRFAFCKEDNVLDLAGEKLKRLTKFT